MSEFVAGRTRPEILAAHPELRSADIDEALTIAKTEVTAGRLPELSPYGTPLSVAELAEIKAPEAMSERLKRAGRAGREGG